MAPTITATHQARAHTSPPAASLFFFIDIAAQLLRLAARVGDGAAGLSLSAVVGCKTTTTERREPRMIKVIWREWQAVSAPPPLQQGFGWGERGGGGGWSRQNDKSRKSPCSRTRALKRQYHVAPGVFFIEKQETLSILSVSPAANSHLQMQIFLH